jgi:hypothetical protein
MKDILQKKNQRPFPRQDSAASLLDFSTDNYGQSALVGKSGMVRTYMWKHDRSVMVAVYGTPCAMPHRKQ